MAELKVKYIPIGDVKPYGKNPRKNAGAVKYVANSLREFGWRQPIVIDSGGVIVAGHTRLLAAQQLGMDTVPVVVADDLTPEQIKAYRLADNKTAEFAEWDADLLDMELDDLDIDMSLFGFELDEPETEPQEITEDEIPEAAEKRCKPGDLWKLGEHRLICGDSTDPAIIEKLMGGQKAELLLTDPPYGIGIVQHKTKKLDGDKPTAIKGKVHGDSKNAIIKQAKEYSPIIGDDTTETAEKCYEVSKQYSANQIIFGGNYFTDFLPPSRCWIVWDKQNSGSFADAELAWTSFDKVVKLYRFMWNGLIREGNRKVEGFSRIHPTQKPVGMLGYILQDFSKDGGNVLDTFGGSGSTLIACEQLKRKCFMAELDPHYCDVIIERWENLTGEKATLLSQE